MRYSYYDYLWYYYDEYYDYYFEYYYWPYYYDIYNVSNDSWCDYVMHHNATNHTNDTMYYDYFNITSTSSSFNSTDSTPWTSPATYFNETHFFNMTAFNCTERYNGTFPPHPWAYEPWWHSSMEGALAIFLTLLTVATATASITLAIVFFRQLHAQMNSRKKTRPDKLTIALSSTCMLSHVAYNCVEFFTYYYWYVDYDFMGWWYSDLIWEVFWCLAKVSIYGLFAYRYFMLQKASISNPLTQKKTVVAFTLIAIIILAQVGFVIAFAFYYFYYNTTPMNDENYELVQRQYLNSAWAIMMIDLVLVVFLGALIMRTILQLVMTINDPTRFAMQSATSREPTTTAQSGSSKTGTGVDVSLQSPASTGDRTQPITAALQGTTKKRFQFRMRSVSSGSRTGSSSPRSNMTSEERRRARTSRQMNLLDVTTRIALLSVISLVSSFVLQFLWIYMEETENWKLSFFGYFWGLDGFTNMLCVYFTMAFAKKQYMVCCGDICKCHHCCLWCVLQCVSRKMDSSLQTEMERVENDHMDSGKATSDLESR